MKKKLIVIIPLALLVISYLASGRRTNPPVEHEVAWASEDARLMFQRACADCHSHETKWPWYTHFAPISWNVISHVNEGREHFNISVQDMGDADEAAEELEEGEMPLKSYVWLHPEAKLTPAEQQRFVAELLATFGGEEEDDDD